MLKSTQIKNEFLTLQSSRINREIVILATSSLLFLHSHATARTLFTTSRTATCIHTALTQW